ncbi:hypothetical protein AO380_0296 [Moraxella catarrhalis]|nr:hypothetical protein AO380_0296 [Moraxella catarrhalis]
MQQLCYNRAWQKYAQLKKIGEIEKIEKIGGIFNSMIRFNHQANQNQWHRYECFSRPMP